MATFKPYYGGYGGKMSNGVGWGGVAPKAKRSMVKEFKKDTGGVKGMSNKKAKIDKAARKTGF